jgi:hypothetical protein
MPVPVREVVCGLPRLLKVTVTLPARFPVAVGVNVTLIVHIPVATTVVPQLLVCVKSPLATMLVMLIAAPVLLLAVIIRAVLLDPRPSVPKESIEGDRVIAEPTPVPLNAIRDGKTEASLVIKMFPASKLTKLGVKVTVKVHAAPAASVAGEMGQLFVVAKLGVGLTEMLRMVSAPLPVLVSVTICAALVVPTS